MSKTYTIPVKYVFEGTFTIKADSLEDAVEMIDKQCGLVLGGNIHTLLNDDEVDWDFNIHPEIIISDDPDGMNITSQTTMLELLQAGAEVKLPNQVILQGDSQNGYIDIMFDNGDSVDSHGCWSLDEQGLKSALKDGDEIYRDFIGEDDEESFGTAYFQFKLPHNMTPEQFVMEMNEADIVLTHPLIQDTELEEVEYPYVLVKAYFECDQTGDEVDQIVDELEYNFGHMEHPEGELIVAYTEYQPLPENDPLTASESNSPSLGG